MLFTHTHSYRHTVKKTILPHNTNESTHRMIMIFNCSFCRFEYRDPELAPNMDAVFPKKVSRPVSTTVARVSPRATVPPIFAS